MHYIKGFTVELNSFKTKTCSQITAGEQLDTQDRKYSIGQKVYK